MLGKKREIIETKYYHGSEKLPSNYHINQNSNNSSADSALFGFQIYIDEKKY